MDHLAKNVLLRAGEVQQVLDVDAWLQFSKLCQLQRYELNQVMARTRQVNPITYMRMAFALETVGIATHLSVLDDDTRMIVMSLGSYAKGEIKDFLEKEWHRVPFTKYVCEDVPLTADMRQRIHGIAERIRKGAKIAKKQKIDLTQAGHIKRMLAKRQAVSADPAAPSVRVLQPAEKHSQSAVDSIITMVSCTASMAAVSVKPLEVNDHDRINLARAVSNLLKTFGVTRAVLEDFQAKRGDGGGLTTIFEMFSTK